MDVIVRIAHPTETDRVRAVYQAFGYNRPIKPEDTVWLAEQAGEAIGVVRIAPESGTLVLRGMRIAERWQRRGVGTRMLFQLVEWLGDRECYCLPYAHLIGFYRQVGFSEITPAQSPAFLAERYAEYRSQGLNVTVMRRRASASG